MNEKGIRFRNGKYYFRVTVTDETGKRRQVERYGGKTEKECIKNKMRFEMEYENKFIKINSKMLLFDVFDLFFESYKKNWNKNTLRNSTIKKQIIKENFENIRIDRVTTYQLQKKFDDLSSKYSKLYLINLKSILNQMFQFAIKIMKILEENPISDIKVGGRKSREKRSYTSDELKKIKDIFIKMKNRKYYYFFVLLLNSGARKSEILALTWDSVDFTNNSIKINKSIYSNLRGIMKIQNSTKNEASNRIVYLNKETMDILKEARLEYKKNKKEVPFFADNGFVFSNEKGELLQSSFVMYFRKTIKKVTDIPSSIHAFRHTHISKLVEMGYSLKAIQDRVGHSDINTTLKVYSHTSEDYEKKIADEVNFFLTKNIPNFLKKGID